MRNITIIFTVGLAFAFTACSGGEVTKVGNPGGTASLTRLADLPELDVSRYDTSHANYTDPTASLALRRAGTREVSSSGRFSRDGCDAKEYKEEMIGLGIFAEEFLCLYKMAEEHYPDDFSVPSGSFNYYTIETDDDTLLGRIGHFADGFGAVTEEVLVIDECVSGERTAEMRVTASDVDENLSGSGYFIRLTETDYLGDEVSDEALSFTLDTRNTLWQISVGFQRTREETGGDWYGTLELGLDTTGGFNVFTTATYDDDIEGIYEIASNTVFGPYTDLEGFTIGGSSQVNVIQSANPENEVMGDIQGFVFDDSPTLPAVQLDATEISEFPFYAELDPLDDPTSDVSEPSLDFQDSWDCTVPEGSSAVAIDLTPEDIEAELADCEGETEVDSDLDCAAIEDAQE